MKKFNVYFVTTNAYNAVLFVQGDKFIEYETMDDPDVCDIDLYPQWDEDTETATNRIINELRAVYAERQTAQTWDVPFNYVGYDDNLGSACGERADILDCYETAELIGTYEQ